jgi:hypothetical protein
MTYCSHVFLNVFILSIISLEISLRVLLVCFYVLPYDVSLLVKVKCLFLLNFHSFAIIPLTTKIKPAPDLLSIKLYCSSLIKCLDIYNSSHSSSIRFGPSLRYIELPIELITHTVLHELANKCPNLTHMLLDFSTAMQLHDFSEMQVSA